MKRSKSIHGNGDGALTPDTPQSDSSLHCPRCEKYIVGLQDQITRLHKVVRDKQTHITSQNDFLDKVRRVLGEQRRVLKPSPTSRPARKGEL
jgi:hypothetical protein